MPGHEKDEISRINHLLEESRGERYNDPARMVYIAELARAASEHLDPDRLGEAAVADIRARTWMELGNAYRLVGALDLAQKAMARSLDYWEKGSRSLELLAPTAYRFGALLSDRRRFPEALALLDRLSLWHYGRGEHDLAGEALIQRGLYTENSGNPEEAVVFTCSGIALIEPDRNQGLVRAGVHNLLWCATSLGFFPLVRRLIPLAKPLYEAEGGRLNLLRLRWVEGRVALGLGEVEEARQAFEEVRRGFFSHKLSFPASMVSLDLLRLLVREERFDRVRVLAEELIGSFSALRVGREAIMALILLRRTCERERIVLREVIQAVRRVEQVLTGAAKEEFSGA